MQRLNCWEFERRGKESCCMKKTGHDGPCPAAHESRTDGINNGINGGRACWAINGTLHSGKAQGAFASKLENCLSCGFYALVQMEEGRDFIPIKEILKKL